MAGLAAARRLLCTAKPQRGRRRRRVRARAGQTPHRCALRTAFVASASYQAVPCLCREKAAGDDQGLSSCQRGLRRSIGPAALVALHGHGRGRALNFVGPRGGCAASCTILPAGGALHTLGLDCPLSTTLTNRVMGQCQCGSRIYTNSFAPLPPTYPPCDGRLGHLVHVYVPSGPRDKGDGGSE
jgi:hypothetical protein